MPLLYVMSDWAVFDSIIKIIVWETGCGMWTSLNLGQGAMVKFGNSGDELLGSIQLCKTLFKNILAVWILWGQHFLLSTRISSVMNELDTVYEITAQSIQETNTDFSWLGACYWPRVLSYEQCSDILMFLILFISGSALYKTKCKRTMQWLLQSSTITTQYYYLHLFISQPQNS
jgi:hypothetical protein